MPHVVWEYTAQMARLSCL